MAQKMSPKPRMIGLLTVFLLLEGPLILLLGLNLLTDHWTFLTSWSVFRSDLREAFNLVLNTPGKIEGGEMLFYSVVAFGVLAFGAAVAFLAGVFFNRGSALLWILSLVAQIAVLLAGIGLYWIQAPSQSYWLMAVGIIMVLYLNNGDVRQWFLHTDREERGKFHA